MLLPASKFIPHIYNAEGMFSPKIELNLVEVSIMYMSEKTSGQSVRPITFKNLGVRKYNTNLM